MKRIKTIHAMQKESEEIRKTGKIIGFIPTMGCLHAGHLSLIRLARDKADIVVVSIFVNPMQFGPNEDLDQYPKDLKRDEALCRQEGTDLIFYPSAEEMYPEDYLTNVTVEKLTEFLCGLSRPNHFRGVATICVKMFNIVKPHFSVFGQKDAQQLVVIRQMVRDLNIDMEIISGPIIRESDGLAKSSRNDYLTIEERADALALFESLELAKVLIHQGEKDAVIIKGAIKNCIEKKERTRIDYIEIVSPDKLIPLPTLETGSKALIALAVFVGTTRLIDNIIVEKIK